MNPNDKILIVMPDKHLGNFVIALNAIKPLRDYYGSKKVAVIFDEAHREMVTENIGLENIIFYPRKQLEAEPSLLPRFKIYWQFIQQIRRFKPTISAALEACNVSALISFFSGAKRRIGLDANKLPLLLNEKIPFRKNVHRLESYFDIMKKLELPSITSLISLQASQADINTVNQILIQKNIDITKPLICIHTGAGKPHKQWPIEKFADLANNLAQTNKYQIILTGGPAEQTQNKIVLSQATQNLYDFACCLTVSQLIALFKKSALLISNDSGPMHIAALSGIPVIALFGPTDETVWGPLSNNACVLSGGAQFRSLDAEKVLNTVRKVLHEKR
jgi:heptosyltransferase III